jgi:hypothetical protein
MVDQPIDCQLLLPDAVGLKSGKIYFDELITGTRQLIKKTGPKKIKLDLRPEKSYIYKIL